MKKHPGVLPFIVLTAAVLGCSVVSSPAATAEPVPIQAVPTETPQPVQTSFPTDTATTIVTATETTAPVSLPTVIPPAVSGLSVSIRGVTLTLPDGVATGAQGEVVPQAEPDQTMESAAVPAYLKITFNGYAVSDSLLQPQVIVVSVDDYAALNPTAGERIEALRGILDDPSLGGEAELRILLPQIYAAQMIRAREGMVSFQNGRGVRFLTQYDQAYLPVNNYELFYTFQGLTDDNRYYVSVVFPVNAPFLQNSPMYEAEIPADGIPFPARDDADFEPKFQEYIALVANKLEGVGGEVFTPSLTDLDGLVSSALVETVNFE